MARFKNTIGFARGFSLAVLLVSSVFSPYYCFGAVSIATISMSGDIGPVFQLTAFSISGDIDLSAQIIVTNRTVGMLHLKYNVNMASFTLKSVETSGLLEKSGTPYVFGATPFQISVGPCSSIDPAKVPLTPAQLAAGVTDIKSAASAALTGGVEEDCSVKTTYSGTNAGSSLSGTYSMTINVTMTSI